MTRFWIVAVALGGCVHLDDRPTATTSNDPGALSVSLAGAPGGIDCINFSFADEDGVTTNVQRALNVATLFIRDLAAGAYSLSAQAYSSGLPAPVSDGDCGTVPVNAPWATEHPVDVVLEPGERTDLQLVLVQTGRTGITPVFADTPRVIAQRQGALGLIASGGGRVAWVVPGTGATASIVAVDDMQDAVPVVLVRGLTNPGEIQVDPASHAVFWTINPSGATDDGGNPVIDGGIGEFDGAPLVLATNIRPSDLAMAGNGHAYWGDLSNDAIGCSGCGNLATDQVNTNAVGAHSDRVYWDDGDTNDVIGMSVTDAAPTILGHDGTRIPYGMAADDTSVYFVDFDPNDPDNINNSFIQSMPAHGGPITTLATGLGPSFPIAVLDGFVYWTDNTRIARVPVTGGSVDDVVDGVISGFAVDHDAEGHGVLYWTDNTHGGLVWRGRVD